MYAIVVCGGKQFKVSKGDIIEVEKINADIGAKVELPAILTVDKDKVTTEQNIAKKVTAEVLNHGKGKKIVVFTYKAKKNERKKKGHRQQFTRLKITQVG